MDVQSNRPGASYVKPNKYSLVNNYIIEYLFAVLIAISVVGITSGSHSIGLPLYKLNPMHWVIFFAILFRKPSLGAIIVLAFALPFTSNLITGHPLLIKSVIMGVELSIYGVVFNSLTNYYTIRPVLAYVISQIAGHIVYYWLKYIMINVGLLDSALISTSIVLQLIVFGCLGLALLCTDKYLLTQDFK